MTLPEIIKSARKARGLSQNELSKRSGVSWIAIQRFESGESDGTWKTVSALCKALGVRVSVDGQYITL